MKKNILILLISFLSFNLISQVTPSGGGISGSGTTNYLPKFTASKKLGNSVLYQLSNDLGVSTTFPDAKFDIYQNSFGSNKKIFNVSYFGKASIFYIDDSAKVRFPVLNANTVPYINSVNALASSTVTPTKLNYLDATSSVQTQLDSKANNCIYKVNTPISVTGTTVETVAFSYSIAAGTIQANDFLDFVMFGMGSNNANLKHIKIYASETNTITGATQLAIYSTTTNSGGVFTFHRFWVFQNSLSSQKICNAITSVPNDLVSQSNNGETTTTINAANTVYIFFTVTLGNATDTYTIRSFKNEILR